MRGKPAKRRQGFKEKIKDKQIKPRREEEKDSVVPEEKRTMTEYEKVLFVRYRLKPEWMG